MKATVLFLIIANSFGIYAQNFVNLDGNNVDAGISDNAVFFNDPVNSVANYEVPAGSNKHSIYATSIWVGAEDINGQVYISATDFNSNGWSSGPIADNQFYGSTNYMNAYGSSIWKISRQEVLDHQALYQQTGYTPVPAIANWPGNGDQTMGIANQLAPFVDNDGDGMYEPLDGDYPEFPGDMAIYVIVNDAANPIQSYLGVELHLLFYQFNNSGYLGETTFLNAHVFNRSTTDYFNFRHALFIDFDIGNYQDDYIGCDSSRNMMYAYNGDTFDETNGGALGYGANPPCQAAMSLNRDLFSATYYTNGAVYPTSDPSTEAEFWNYMNGLWADGSTMYYGGNAYNTGTTSTPTQFVFTGNPFTGTGWTEVNANNGAPNPPEDRRGVMINHVGNLPAGTSLCSDFAFIYDDDDSNLENVQNVKLIADALQNFYDTNTAEFPCGYLIANTMELDPIELSVYPNPSSGTFSVELGSITSAVILEIRDMSGRLIYTEILYDPFRQFQLDLPAGTYQVSVQSSRNKAIKPIVIR